MRRPARRSPQTRLILTLAVLASLIGGYYAGQYWQRRPLADLSAIVYPSGKRIDYPADMAIGRQADGSDNWRLFVVADSRDAQCRELVMHYASVFNRLAAWPGIQDRLRLTLLAYDAPDPAAVTALTGDVAWAEVIGDQPARLDRLAAQLGILPSDAGWCGPHQADAILVAPDHMAWALIPHEQAAIMAHDIRTIIAFVE